MKLILFITGVGIVIYLVALLPHVPRVVEVKLLLQNGEVVSEAYCSKMHRSDCYNCTSGTYCSPIKVVEILK